MLTPDQLAAAFDRNRRILAMQAEGLSHQDSLVVTPYNINTLNWVLGHIAHYRDRTLRLLGHDGVMDEATGARYARESDPVVEDGPVVVALHRLLDTIEEQQARLETALAEVTPAQLEEEITAGDRPTTRADRLFFNYFHDTYHTGQTELLRQVAGTNDKVL